jgi:hypothetical protein
MDWFERLTGFKEVGYDDTRARLEVLDGRLRSRVNGRTYGIGQLELASLGELRDRAAAVQLKRGRLTFRNIVGDVRALHQRPEFDRALFQVASQFNLLEMVGPSVTPEQGVTRYQQDRTQGPACAIAAGAATIYRNYFAPINGQAGQTSSRQLDGLADLGAALAEHLGRPADSLWTMQNGYALCAAEGLRNIGGLLGKISEPEKDALRALLRIGVHTDVEVTEADTAPPQLVSQAFCSALPVAYTGVPRSLWNPFAELVLEAAYEATLLVAALNVARGASDIVLLTQLGGGAFGNDGTWIDAAIKRALKLAAYFDLDVRMVNYGSVPPTMLALEKSMEGG